jgi:Na+-driven multidrug efflux pump
LSGRAGGGYGRGARVLSVGIAATGLVTFAYFALASRALGRDEYARITLVWSVMFVVASVLYRRSSSSCRGRSPSAEPAD